MSKGFSLFIIGFCAFVAVYDFAVGNYGWGLFQAFLCALNIHSYRSIRQ